MTADFTADVVDYQELAAAVRQRIIDLNVSQEAVEVLAGIPPGYLAKITASPPIRRASPFTWFLVLQALSLKVTLNHDSEMAERMSRRYESRKIKMVRAKQGLGGSFEPAPDYRRRIASLGGQARAKLSNLSEINRRANLTRWRRVRQQAGLN